MIAVTRDAAWAARLRGLAVRGGWPFAAFQVLPGAGAVSDSEHAIVVLDRADAGSAAARAVAVLRALFPSGRVALACTEAELGADVVAADLSAGVDEVVGKSWTDARLFTRLSALRDAALASAVRLSADGTLKAELRSRRVFRRVRARWTELPLPAAEFGVLWALLGAGGQPVSRAALLDALRGVSGRDVESETVSRRVLSLRRGLARWKGAVESVRGGFYRIVAPRD